MKFVIAPDKFKGSLTGIEFCDAVEKGLRQDFMEANIVKLPLADGGDGTIEVVRYYLGAETIELTVNDPLFRPIKASYLFSPDTATAYIEMAEASGLKLLNNQETNCMLTTTLGTGELLSDAIKRGAKKIILGIGGSATNDAGMGMATALGFRFLDKEDRPLKPIGSNLIHVKKIDASAAEQHLKNIEVEVACDVTNPFYGPDGAAYVYAEQKGASKEDIIILDKGLKNLAGIINEQYEIDVQKISGAGAAGGLGAASCIFLNARLSSGIELIKGLANFDANIEDADWIITGEGRLDDQTLSGKTIQGVLKSAKKSGISVAAFCGAIDVSEDTAKKMGLNYMVSVSKDMPNLEQAIKHSYKNVMNAALDFAKSLK